jgi:hypothetical protein
MPSLAVSRQDASPNEILRAVSHIDTKLIGAVDPAETPVNELFEGLSTGFFNGEQTQRGQAVLVYRIDGIPAGYPTAVCVV